MKAWREHGPVVAQSDSDELGDVIFLIQATMLYGSTGKYLVAVVYLMLACSRYISNYSERPSTASSLKYLLFGHLKSLSSVDGR